MNKSTVAAVLSLIITIQTYGQEQCKIQNHYEDFISIKKSIYDEHIYLTRSIIKTKTSSCLADLVNNNALFIEYLLMNFSSHSNFQKLEQISDSSALSKAYFSTLKKRQSVYLDNVRVSR